MKTDPRAYVLGVFDWETGALRLTMVAKGSSRFGRWQPSSGQYEPEPDRYKTTTELDDAFKWRSRQAAAKWRDSNYMPAEMEVVNLAQLGASAQQLAG